MQPKRHGYLFRGTERFYKQASFFVAPKRGGYSALWTQRRSRFETQYFL
jgi:hypothetical protein